MKFFYTVFVLTLSLCCGNLNASEPQVLQKELESTLIIRQAALDDFAGIKELYQAVAKQGGGIARSYQEITNDYIKRNLDNALKKGKMYVAVSDGKIVGSLHCYKLEPAVFSHVLSELTIAVRPDYQGKGAGKKLFLTLLNAVKDNEPSILRVELMARESNTKAINFYKSIGFVQEGRLVRRICNSAGNLEADIAMAWFNPNYKDMQSTRSRL